jgi:hypothetical protein
MKQLLKAVEQKVNEAPYTHAMVSLAWIKLLDDMQEHTVLSLDKVTKMAEENGMDTDNLSYALQFLNDMGMLLWRGEDPVLRDLVVLDPIRFFVEAVTKVICNIQPTTSEGSLEHHYLDEHRECQKRCPSQWNQLCQEGRLHSCLLPILWGKEQVHRENISVLATLAVHYGLFVALSADDHDHDHDEDEDEDEHAQEQGVGHGQGQGRGRGDDKTGEISFLVPSLLDKPDPSNSHLFSAWSALSFNSCFFCFTSSSDLERQIPVYPEDMMKQGFLPSDFFCRLLGKLVSWYEHTHKRLFSSQAAVFKTLLIMNHGSQRFRVEHCPHINAIRLDVEGSPKAVMKLLSRLIQRVIDECFTLLKFFIALSCSGAEPKVEDYNRVSVRSSLGSQAVPVTLFVALSAIEALANRKSTQRTVLTIRKTGQPLLDHSKAVSFYEDWLPKSGASKFYDFFESYRWNKFDSDFCRQISDHLELQTVGAANRAPNIFLDVKALALGERFDEAFANALAICLIAVTVISASALERMKDHDADQIDNCLMEWIMILVYARVGKIRLVMPVVFGTISYSSAGGNSGVSGGLSVIMGVPVVGNFWEEKHLEQLPDVVPTATLEGARRHLARNLGAEAADRELGAERMTVKTIVALLLKFNTECFGWRFQVRSLIVTIL